VFDPVARIGGVIHCLLPLSSADPARAATEPALYVDTGVALLLEQLFQRGAQKKNLAIAAAGAGNINDERNVFEIGRKNHTVFRKLMWKNGLLVRAEHVGNPHSTTLVLDLEAGTAFAKTSTGIHPLFEEGRR
jgi:chemotaxis protein CheD